MLEPNEQILSVVHKHIIGIIGLYFGIFGALIAIVVFVGTVTPDIFSNLSSQSNRALLGGMLLAATILLLFLFVSNYVYRQSRLIITDRSLVQMLQKSLFIKKISRLNFANVEDVSAEQRGILSTMFGYGTLRIQTAGASENFIFNYCPNPSVYADIIIEARQQYAESLHEEPSH